MTRSTWAALSLAVAFYALALSHDVYDVTSPSALGWHVLLRKAYSVGAFGSIAFCLRAALERRGLRPSRVAIASAGILAIYSAAIEIGQALAGSREGLGWNAVDVACGAIGGALGAVAAWRSGQGRSV